MNPDREYTDFIQLIKEIEAAFYAGDAESAGALFTCLPAPLLGLPDGREQFVSRFSRIHRPDAGVLWDQTVSYA